MTATAKISARAIRRERFMAKTSWGLIVNLLTHEGHLYANTIG